MRLISGAAAQLQADGWRKPELQSLYELIHRLAGSAAIYGFDGIGRAAADLEEWALSAIDGARRRRGGASEDLLGALDEAFTASRTFAAVGGGRRGSNPLKSGMSRARHEAADGPRTPPRPASRCSWPQPAQELEQEPVAEHHVGGGAPPASPGIPRNTMVWTRTSGQKTRTRPSRR